MQQLVDIVQYALSGLATGSIYAAVALGFTIVFSSTELVNFAHGEFVMLGAMFSYTFSQSLHWPIAASVVGGAATAAIVGAMLGRLLTRSLANSSPVSLIIVTIGASMLLQGLAGQFWGKDAVALAPFSDANAVLVELPKADTPIVIMPQQLWVFGITAFMFLCLSLFFGKTMAGKALRAIAANRIGAGLVGIGVNKLVVGAFALAAAIGALAGATIAPISCGYYNMGTIIGLKGFAAAIVGGLGNFTGSIVAGLLLGLFESLGAGYISSNYKDALAFIVLLAVLFWSPNGIMVPIVRLFRKRGTI